MTNILVSEINGLKVYNLSAGRTLQEMLTSAKYNIKKLKKDDEFLNKIELIQNFDYPISSSCIKLTDDGSHLFTAGLYAPRLKIYDLNEMSLKVERGLDSEVRRIATISNDYTKCALLLDDRNIEVHAQYGRHFNIRIPKFGRDMIYNKYSCDLLTCGTGNEVYRLNLCEGSFLKPFETSIDGINSLRYNSYLDILGFCGDMGKVEIWDNKTQNKINGLPILENAILNNYDSTELTSIEFNNYLMAVGNKEGKTSVYDLRFPNPIYSIKHSYKFPIKSIKFHESSCNIITIDKKLIKFSNSKTGKVFTNIESTNDINELECYEGSGMFFTANESPKMDIFFVPGLGPAPKWCSFLEKITEELEDEKTYNLYEDHKFLVMKDLEELSCTNLIGTNLLKPYMHGYFMDMKLYKKLRALAQPMNYEKYLEDEKEKRLNKILGDRIIVNKTKKVKVNKEIFENENKKELTEDSRFTKLFENEDFKVDYNSQAFKQNKAKTKANDKRNYENKINENEIEQEEKEEKTHSKIVNPKLMDLNQKLIEKKKQTLNYIQEDDEEDFENRINNLVSEDVNTIKSQIKKENRKIKTQNEKVERKDKFNNKNLDGRRLLKMKRK